MKKSMSLFLILSLFLVGCTGYVTPALESDSYVDVDENKRVRVGDLLFEFPEEHYSVLFLERNRSMYVYIVGVAFNEGPTSIHAKGEAYLVDHENKRQYDVVDYPFYEIEEGLGGTAINAYWGYSLQPNLAKGLVWGFEVPFSNANFTFYHQPLEGYPTLIV